MAADLGRVNNAALSDCHRATELGNRISVHMLDFLSTVKHYPQGFDELAHDFLEVCRIMWSIEAGLSECNRNGQGFPADMIKELDRKFRTTFADFQTLDQWLDKFLDYEKRGTMGKIQRGWRKMFADNGIDKLRMALCKTKETLRMSALIFQWSLGDAKIDDSVGIGYIGLSAALERMDKGRSVAGINKVKSLGESLIQVNEIAISPPPSLPPTVDLSQRSTSDFNFPSPLMEERISSQHPRRTASISDRTSSSVGAKSRFAPPTIDSIERGSSHHHYPVQSPVRSPVAETMDAMTLVDDDYSTEANKVVRIKSDPFTMPRFTPRSTSGGDTPALKAALISSIESKNHALVEQILDRGVSPDTGTEFNALVEAVSQKDSEIIRLLLLFGADPNSTNELGATPLLLAVEESFLEGASMLLKYGADPNLSFGKEALSPLSLAIVEDKLALTRLLLTYGGHVDHNMADGDTILIKAISMKRSKKMIDLILDYGADADAKNGEGKTPLFEAIQSGRVEIVTSLLDHNANPNLPGPKHMLWPSTYHPAILKVLLARGADPKKAPGIMELAASINKIESIQILLKANVSPNIKKDGVFTPLCTSIRDNRKEIFELLISHGADPNLPASEYPCFKCITHNRLQFLPALVAAGADIHNPKGILVTAVESGNIDALTYLLDQPSISLNDKRAPPQSSQSSGSTADGPTPLTTAIRLNKSQWVDLLLARGANPNIRGETWPVFLAVQNPPLLRKLLPHLAEPRAYKGVMEMAASAHQLESVKLLLAAGVSVEDRNGGVFSPLTSAIRDQQTEMVRYLLEEAGADPNSPGEHLPIVKGVRRCPVGRGGEKDFTILEMLLKHGADPNKVYRGHSAVIQAVENGDAGILKLLVTRAGVDLGVVDGNGMTVLEIAEARDWEEGKSILMSGKRVDFSHAQ